MTTTANHSAGAKGRKTLASQIDRLDNILDGLAEGLNEAIATFVKDAVELAVREAVQAVLTEVLTNPDVLARLHSHVPQSPPTTAKPTLAAKLGTFQKGVAHTCQSVVHVCRTRWQQLWQGLCTVCQKALPLGSYFRNTSQWLVHNRMVVLTAMAVGATICVVAFLTGPWISALLSGVAGFVSTLAPRTKARLLGPPQGVDDYVI